MAGCLRFRHSIDSRHLFPKAVALKPAPTLLDGKSAGSAIIWCVSHALATRQSLYLFNIKGVNGDVDISFKTLDAALEKHVNRVDPIGKLRSIYFADYRKDPRHIRLLNKAGFDDEGNIR